MKRRLDKVVRARQLQRDEAREHLGRSEQRLRELEGARLEAVTRWRARLGEPAGAQLSARDLELMAATHQTAAQAEERSRRQLSEARQQAAHKQMALRQIEILQARAVEQARAESDRQEQRQQDANANNRRRGALLGLLLVLLAGADGGCNRVEATPAPAPVDEGVEGEEQGPQCADEQFSPEELALLRKLRERSSALRKQEATLERRLAQLAEVKAAVAKDLKALRQQREAAAPVESPSETETLAEARQQELAAAQREQERRRARLTEVIEKMSVRAAGAMLGEMPSQTSATLLMRLPAALAGRILAKLPPARAAEVAEALRSGSAKDTPASTDPPAGEGGPATAPAAGAPAGTDGAAAAASQPTAGGGR